jgi:poly-gamma-glutamate capsule biosynthesis protein CapA/YwtB (metallophosphatase superfamily)
LNVGLRALALDGRSLLDRGVANEGWPLGVAWGVREPGLAVAARLQRPAWNRAPEALGSVVVTGVTAMARSVHTTMAQRGDMAYPAHQVAGLLAGADVAHVSNEASFWEGCVPNDNATAFCAPPAAFATLQALGVDVVELTGNHNNDVGPEAALGSLARYREAGMVTFGGGADAASARGAGIVTAGGSRIAFLGYNQFGPEYAWASEQRPGANRWPGDVKQLEADIAGARAAGATLVFVHVQHTESYGVAPLPEQRADFRAAIDAGADAVVGSQAHTPQAIELYRGRPIFYGLGNLIFDQMQSFETRSGLVVRYTVMGGRLLQAELFVTVIEEYAQPRFATATERQAVLDGIWGESGVVGE